MSRPYWVLSTHTAHEDQTMNDNGALLKHAQLVLGLREPTAYPHPADAIEVIETHISSVVLAGEFAYKLKKPVNLGFVDFSSLERRRHYCEEEIRLNRRGAPSLYLDVVPITGDIDHPHAGPAPGPILEYAVRMRRFGENARLDRLARAGRLSATHIDRLATSVAAYHEQCEVAPAGRGFGSPQLILRWASENLADLEQAALAPAQARRIKELRNWTQDEFARRAALFELRRNTGRVRECHGDLHLGNIVLLDDTPVPFDCIEFNDELRYIDVVNDVAFAFMDLIDHGLATLAWRFLGAYLECVGDYEGLGTLRFYAVYRALVRAKIALIRHSQPDTPVAEKAADWAALDRYVKVAHALAKPVAPQLIATCGVTASGKTTVAQVLLEQLGAVRLRSDLERKRLYSIAATDHSSSLASVGGGLYDAAATQRTYDRLAVLASVVLDAGITAIVDASFLEQSHRQMFRELANARAVRFTIIECDAPPATLRSRLVQRLAQGSDASDATARVLAHQLATRQALTAAERALAVRLDTDTEPARLLTRCIWLARRLKGDSRRKEKTGMTAAC